MPESITEDDSLPSEFSEDPIIGDSVVTIPAIPPQEKKMAAVDLPESVASQLLTESVGNIQFTNASGRAIANIAMGSLQAGVAKTHNELGTEESRAISGVMATPIASPTTGGGS